MEGTSCQKEWDGARMTKDKKVIMHKISAKL